MYAMMLDENNAFKWTKVPDPVPGPGEIVIETHAAALNRADLLQRAGKYPPPPGWPEWMGLEVAGTVAHAPPDARFKTGDKVCALLGGGGYAEKVKVPQEMVMSTPAGLSLTEAASLPEVYATAYLNLCMEAGIKAGDTVLIQAGASGLGMAAIQLAKSYGAKVITTVSSEKKAQAVQALGADIVVNHRSSDLAPILEANPTDIVLDCVGGINLGRHLKKLAPGGRWILIATLAGETTEIELRSILKCGLRLIGSTLRSRKNETKGLILSELETKIWPGFASGTFKPTIYQTLPIAKAQEAHAILERNENLGKVVLTLS